MAYKIEKLADGHTLAEGPFWEEERQALYYVDCFQSTINRYLPNENRFTSCKVDESNGWVSIIIPIKEDPNKFLVSINNNLTVVTWDGESASPENVNIIHSIEKENKNIRYNDGKIDPTGRLWIGTIGAFIENNLLEPNVGSLYSFSKDLEPTKQLENTTTANGTAWSPDKKTFYFLDSSTGKLEAFDWDLEAGILDNRRVVFDFATEIALPPVGGPDGMVADTDGNLWIAVLNGGAVYQVDPTAGKIIRKIDFPSLQTASLAFGGPDLEDLYVVTGNFALPEEVIQAYPDVGAIFRVIGLGVKGQSTYSAEFS